MVGGLASAERAYRKIVRACSTTRRALEQILELFTDVPRIGGSHHHRRCERDTGFTERLHGTGRSAYGDIFKKNVAVTGIEFLGFENPHTATADDPY